ncbi:MAG: ureidoglycolate lyase [Candidimonas sp.]|nr:ureidoglycolate lyase [Candidimonas sp.]NYT46229.1 ureidoglycolate lyase [Alcaligenaceae bacterium]
MSILKLEILTRVAFAPFGDVIETEGRESYPINKGTTQRFHDLASVQIADAQGRAGISLARGNAFNYPLSITMLERHPLGSQAWIPCNQTPFVAIVAPNGPNDTPDESGLRAFYVQGNQGVNYHRGTWHHPLVTLGQQGDFIVVDRVGEGENCDEHELSISYVVDGSYAGSQMVQA